MHIYIRLPPLSNIKPSAGGSLPGVCYHGDARRESAWWDWKPRVNPELTVSFPNPAPCYRPQTPPQGVYITRMWAGAGNDYWRASHSTPESGLHFVARRQLQVCLWGGGSGVAVRELSSGSVSCSAFTQGANSSSARYFEFMRRRET